MRDIFSAFCTLTGFFILAGATFGKSTATQHQEHHLALLLIAGAILLVAAAAWGRD